MVNITIEEIAENLSAYLERVQAGEHFLVLQAGTPIAEILPPRRTGFSEALRQFREKMVTEGVDINSDDLFEDIRDRTPTPDEVKW
jgi:antitoxin (DNA-binding transcriptional repressor) of toxin-antitoxin stability system